MIRSNTWIVLLLFVAVVLGSVLFNRYKAQRPAEEEAATEVAETRALFTSEEGQPSSIRVTAGTGEATELAHNDAGQWILIAPVAGPADQGLAEAAASQVSTLRVLDEVNELTPDLLGLARPSYVVTVIFTGGTIHKLDVGELTPTQAGYYVRLDGQSTLIVSATGLDALLGLASAPPYAPTPTAGPFPLAEPTETAAP
jgi:hypothetical protein